MTMHSLQARKGQGAWLPKLVIFAAVAAAALLAQAMIARAHSYAELFERTAPAIVEITASQKIEQEASGAQPDSPQIFPFPGLEDFFDNFDNFRDKGPKRSVSGGAGFLISSDGYIVTNAHVVDEADKITIEFHDGSKKTAEIIGIDSAKNSDIALLKVESDEPLAFLKFGDSDKVRVGDGVIAIGNPLGVGTSISAGIISGRSRQVGGGTYVDYFQTDAAINKGNSGGPLLNEDGEVIGVNTVIISPTGGSIGVGFANSSAVVQGVVRQLREHGHVRRAWLGVQISGVDQDMADAIGLPDTGGALVSEVLEGPARDAGILDGDVIIKFDGEEIDGPRKLTKIVGAAKQGSSVPIVVYRDGVEIAMTARLGERESGIAKIYPASTSPSAPVEKGLLGMTVSPLDDSLRQKYGVSKEVKGLVVTDVDASAPASEKGIREGDVILVVGNTDVSSVSDMERALSESLEAGRKSVRLRFKRGDTKFFLAIPNSQG